MPQASEDERSPLGGDEIAALLQAYLPREAAVSEGLYGQFAVYLRLLLKWNARTNLSAIRQPEEMVRRHFGESLFAAQHIGIAVGGGGSLLDFGSGAGFPGLPIQLMRPDVQVTLAESQNKKAAFLREAVRTLGLSTEIWPGRAEAMPRERRFDVVTLRAVDRMDTAIALASLRVRRRMLLMTTVGASGAGLPGFAAALRVRIPDSDGQELVLLDRQDRAV